MCALYMYVNHNPMKLCIVKSCFINMQKENTPLEVQVVPWPTVFKSLFTSLCSHNAGIHIKKYSKPSLKVCLCSDLGISSRSFWKEDTRWALSFIQMKKGNTFTRLFPQSLPAKQSPHVCWQLKIGLSAWGNAQAQSHYQTKLSSDVEPVYFWGVKSEAFLLFVIGGWKEGWERRD